MGIICQTLLAQGVRISGTLTDNEGPVMMGNVVERDANNRIVSAAQTDFNGNFSMQIKSTKNKLVFSYVGDKTKVITIGNQTVFKVKLEPENTQIKEVVVTSKRQNNGGLMIQKKEISVSQQTFNMEQVEGLAFTSADEALQGEIAGLDIVSNSGNLGAGTTMRLRGVTTISGDANPLIVVDDKDDLAKLADAKEKFAQFVKDAPLAIVVAGDPQENECWIEDGSIAAISMQLQAEDLGLGSCWAQMRNNYLSDGTASEDVIRGILDIPENMRVLCVVAFGHKADERKPQNEDRLKWENVHIGKF